MLDFVSHIWISHCTGLLARLNEFCRLPERCVRKFTSATSTVESHADSAMPPWQSQLPSPSPSARLNLYERLYQERNNSLLEYLNGEHFFTAIVSYNLTRNPHYTLEHLPRLVKSWLDYWNLWRRYCFNPQNISSTSMTANEDCLRMC